MTLNKKISDHDENLRHPASIRHEGCTLYWRHTIFRTTLYGSILACCLGLLIFQASRCIMRYLDFETATGDKYVHTSKTIFPALTFCPSYPYKSDRMDFHGTYRTGIQKEALWVSNHTTVSPQELYEDVTIPLEDIVMGVDIHAAAEIDGEADFTFEGNTSFCGHQLYRPIPYYHFGVCYEFTMPKCLEELGIFELVFRVLQQTDIFLHHPGQFQNSNSRSRVNVEKGSFIKIAVAHEVVQLEEEENDCVNQYENLENSFDGCIYDELSKLMMSELGCTVPWLHNRSNICVEEGKRKEAFRLYQKNRRNQNGICSSSCLFTHIYFGPPVTGLVNEDKRDTYGQAVFYYRNDIKTTREYYLYSNLSMLAEIGGYVGLFMGFSLLDLGRFVSGFLDKMYHRKKNSLINYQDSGRPTPFERSESRQDT